MHSNLKWSLKEDFLQFQIQFYVDILMLIYRLFICTVLLCDVF